MDRAEVEVHKQGKKPKPISRHIGRISLVNKGFIIWQQGRQQQQQFRGKIPRIRILSILSGQDSLILPAHNAGFTSSFLLAGPAI